MSANGGYEIEINGQKATVVVAHYNAIQVLIEALKKIDAGTYNGSVVDVARDALQRWDKARAETPVVLIVMKGGPQT